MLIFDARLIARPYTGLGRYTYSLLEALLGHQARPERLEVLFDSNCTGQASANVAALRALMRADDTATFIDAPVFSPRHHVVAAQYVNSRSGREYFYPHYNVPLLLTRKATFVVHDLLPLSLPVYLHHQRLLRRIAFRALAATALRPTNRHCIAVSAATRSEIFRLFPWVDPGRVTVAHNASCLSAAEDPIPEWVEKLGPYLLYVGDRRPNKNIKKMVDVFRQLRACHGYAGQFLIVGSLQNYAFDLNAYVAGDPGIRFVPQASDETLSALYRKTDCFFFLSLCEGFGMPVLEAAQFNVRVVTSNRSALDEIAPPTALKLDPEGDAVVLAQKMAAYLAASQPIDNAEYLRRFTWKKTAETIFHLRTNG